MTSRSVTQTAGRPVARNPRLSPPEVRENIRKLLHDHGEIEVHCIHDYYRYFFNKTICAIDMGYPEGLLGYLRSLGGMIEIRRDGRHHFVSLTRSNHSSQQALEETEQSENDLHIKKSLGQQQLFDKNNFIWTSDKVKGVLDKTNLMIEKSAFESALECYGTNAISEIGKCHRYLEKFPDGISMTLINLRINKHIFNIASTINSLTLELPEIFYRVETGTDDPLIFNGRTHTINIEEEKARLNMETLDEAIVTDAINSGLYQQTLILIRHTVVRGLKLNVWSASILKNFFSSCDPDDREKAQTKIFSINVIEWFLALARNNLLEIQSFEDIKNDLRAFLPRKPLDYFVLKKKYRNLFNDGMSESNEEPPKLDRKRTVAVLKQKQQS